MSEFHHLPVAAHTLLLPEWRPELLERLDHHLRSVQYSSRAGPLFIQTALNDLDERLQIDRLAHVLIHACLQTALPVVRHGERGECNNMCIPETLNGGREVPSHFMVPDQNTNMFIDYRSTLLAMYFFLAGNNLIIT